MTIWRNSAYRIYYSVLYTLIVPIRRYKGVGNKPGFFLNSPAKWDMYKIGILVRKAIVVSKTATMAK